MDTPAIFVAFGVTGDLMRLKILPALFSLHTKGELPERFALVGVSRRDWSNADLRAHVADGLSAHIKDDGHAQKLQTFLQSLFFIKIGRASCRERVCLYV